LKPLRIRLLPYVIGEIELGGGSKRSHPMAISIAMQNSTALLISSSAVCESSPSPYLPQNTNLFESCQAWLPF
jgi:hypothetical protein